MEIPFITIINNKACQSIWWARIGKIYGCSFYYLAIYKHLQHSPIHLGTGGSSHAARMIHQQLVNGMGFRSGSISKYPKRFDDLTLARWSTLATWNISHWVMCSGKPNESPNGSPNGIPWLLGGLIQLLLHVGGPLPHSPHFPLAVAKELLSLHVDGDFGFAKRAKTAQAPRSVFSSPQCLPGTCTESAWAGLESQRFSSDRSWFSRKKSQRKLVQQKQNCPGLDLLAISSYIR